MNLAINDMDMPLIIKVASIPKERMQVYFIDNEDYFKRRAILHDEKGKIYKDNDERMIFFTKGVIETVKKLNWSPDIIHLHGWFTSLFPLYLKTYYADEPLFAESKIVSSIYKQDFNGVISKKIHDKVTFDNIDEADITDLKNATYNSLCNIASYYSDGTILASSEIPEEVKNKVKDSNKPNIELSGTEDQESIIDFYSTKI